MTKASTSVGYRFQNFLLEKFPELSFTGVSPHVPDFNHSEMDFWLEAKAGNIRWGARPKENQAEDFRELVNVVYALGFHNLDGVNKKVRQKTERGRQSYLERNMHIVQVCFVSDSMMNLLLEHETRESKKSGERYCMVKNSVLNNLFGRREFTRFGQTAEPESYYGFSYSDYKFFTHYDNAGLYWRAILDPREDKAFIRFMKGKGVLGAS